jgi:hypothetical protein
MREYSAVTMLDELKSPSFNILKHCYHFIKKSWLTRMNKSLLGYFMKLPENQHRYSILRKAIIERIQIATKVRRKIKDSNHFIKK